MTRRTSRTISAGATTEEGLTGPRKLLLSTGATTEEGLALLHRVRLEKFRIIKGKRRNTQNCLVKGSKLQILCLDTTVETLWQFL